jgi:erythromycin esterase-like protein
MKTLIKIRFYLFVILLVSGCADSDSLKLNLDFESIKSDHYELAGWDLFEEGYNIALDKKVRYSGKYSLRIESDPDNSQYKGSGSISYLYHGIQDNQRIKVTGFIKNESTNKDSIGLFIGCYTVRGNSENITHSEQFFGTHDWQEYSVELVASKETKYLTFGAILSGPGKIWVDNIRLFIDDNEVFTQSDIYSYRATRNEINRLKSSIIPIKTVKAENGFEDLKPLKQALQDARIIALGENTHGSREVFEMRHRMIEFLTTEMGFNVFAIESFLPVHSLINQYIQTGSGEPLKAMNTLVPAWNTQEVLQMVQWMKRYNQDAQTKLRFFGFDIDPEYASLNTTRYYRDSCMAVNVERILNDNPTSKIILWAHNEHISKDPLAMGHYLNNRFGNEYYCIGFSSDKGKYTAGSSERYRISTDNKFVKSITGSIDYNFSRAGSSVFFLDLRNIPENDPDSRWLTKKMYFRTIGAFATDNQFHPASIKEKFDGVIFIDRTTATEPLYDKNGP